MNTYFLMDEVCPFFLLKAQKPLSSTIITGVGKILDSFYVCINTRNSQQIKSFIDRLSEIGTVLICSEIIGSKDNKCYLYTPSERNLRYEP